MILDDFLSEREVGQFRALWDLMVREKMVRPWGEPLYLYSPIILTGGERHALIDPSIYEDVVERLEAEAVGLRVNRLYIEQRPPGCSMRRHTDTLGDHTGGLTAVIYLNSTFYGGETIIHHTDGDTQVVQPWPGRAVLYDGFNINHEVSKISGDARLTLAAWLTGELP